MRVRNPGNRLPPQGRYSHEAITTYLVGEESRAPWLEARNAVCRDHFGDGPIRGTRS
jgi:hypothetical protein